MVLECVGTVVDLTIVNQLPYQISVFSIDNAPLNLKLLRTSNHINFEIKTFEPAESRIDVVHHAFFQSQLIKFLLLLVGYHRVEADSHKFNYEHAALDISRNDLIELQEVVL